MRIIVALVMLGVLGIALVNGTCVLDARCPLVEDMNGPTQVPHATQCGKFYTCSYGQACEKTCPDGLHFSSALKRCDWPSVACCDASIPCVPNPADIATTTVSTTPGTSTGCIVDARCPLDDNPYTPKLLRHESDCSQFYKCSYGRRCPLPCKSGEHFSEQLQRCDWPAIACCDASVTCQLLATTIAPAVPTVTPSVVCIPDARCPLVESNPLAPLLLPVPGNCGAFYKCRTGDACLLACPAGQHFSQTLQLCERPEVACCDSSVAC